MNCPKCEAEIRCKCGRKLTEKDAAKVLAAKGGRKSKRRLTSEQSAEMNRKRWAK